jgi:hypothetical protein
VNHTVEISSIVIFVSWAAAVMIERITYDVVSTIGDILKINVLITDVPA